MTVSSYTEVSVCNIALALIGETAINTITDPETDVEATCATLYPITRDDLLSKHEWNFANPIRELAVDADAPAVDGWQYAHRLPANMLAGPFAVWGDGSTRPVADYAVINNHVYSNYAVIKVRFREQVLVSEWPHYFVNLVAHALGAALAKPVAENSARAEELRIIAFGSADKEGMGGLFANARRLDAQSRPIKSMFAMGDPLSATRY